LTRRRQARRGGRLGPAALGVAVALSGCTDAAGYDLDYILAVPAFIATMRTTVAPEPQTMPRMPAPGTVPVASPIGEVLPAFGQAQLDSAAATLTNPLPRDAATLARGAVVYHNQCFSCHGPQGEGNGPVIGGGRFPLGPAVNAGPSVGYSDGYLYGVIRVGRGLMPAYGERITHNDRWAVVHYLRELQGQPVAPVGPVAPGPVVPEPAPPGAPAATGAPATAPPQPPVPAAPPEAEPQPGLDQPTPGVPQPGEPAPAPPAAP
jgi:mono/diheme cytochrome c family protein